MSDQIIIKNRVGFHYFQDTTHYTNKDLAAWLPRLQELAAGWIVLRADPSRAIPEPFLCGLIDAGITPIVQLILPLPNTPDARDVKAILEAYSRWGVKYIILMDKPNMAQSWSSSSWSQQDLVERFIDRFLPLALLISQLKMTPIFPPLQPGGDYWDLTFLKQALGSIKRRGRENLINHMGFSAYAYTYDHDLEWGYGGQTEWPETRPYETSGEFQNQCGFNNYEWINTIVHGFCKIDQPFFILGTGAIDQEKNYSPEDHAGIVRGMLDRLNKVEGTDAIPDYVKCCNFFTLSAEENDETLSFAWFKPDGSVLPIVSLMTQPAVKDDYSEIGSDSNKSVVAATQERSHLFEHYLLIPDTEEGIGKFNLKAIQPFIQEYHPTIGFSPEEASKARRVTLVDGDQVLPEEFFEKMHENGCIVDHILEDGTSIATTLVER